MLKPKNYSKFMYVVYNKINVIDGIEISLENVRKEPIIRFDRIGNANKGKYHLFVIVDKDAFGKFFIHYCIYNIEDDNIDKSDMLYSYLAPSPPMNTGKHHYYCILYEYNTKLDEFSINKRTFDKFEEFKKLFKTKIIPKASKYFICYYGN